MNKKLKLRPEIVKVLEENIGERFLTLVLIMISWIRHPKHRQQK